MAVEVEVESEVEGEEGEAEWEVGEEIWTELKPKGSSSMLMGMDDEVGLGDFRVREGLEGRGLRLEESISKVNPEEALNISC